MAAKLKLARNGRGMSRGYVVVAGYNHDLRGRPLPRTRFGRLEEDRVPVREPSDVLEVAELFGYAVRPTGNRRTIAAARAYLAAHVGMVIRDPGCF